MSARGIPVTTVDELEAIVGRPIPRVAEKVRQVGTYGPARTARREGPDAPHAASVML